MTSTVMIVAGGTGGHIFPGLAVAEQWLAAGWQVCWVSGQRDLEKQLLSMQAQIQHATLDFQGVRGRSWQTWWRLPGRLGRALRQSRRLLRHYRPQLVIGFGGYLTVPMGIMSWLSRVPFCLHEQNARAGLANRFLQPIAKRCFTGFPGVLVSAQTDYVGNPVRAILHTLPPPLQRFQNRQGPLRVLIMGGSLGAQYFNEFFPRAFGACPPEHRPIIYHQTGVDTAKVADAYAQAGIQATVQTFFHDMAAVYAAVDFVIGRAGALTIAELSCVGMGALCIPYPFAVDDHQYHNAAALAETGGIHLWRQNTVTTERFIPFWSALTRADCLRYAQSVYQVLPMKAAETIAAYGEAVSS